MKSRWLAIVLAVVFAAGMLYFFGLEYRSGEVYPDLSSLRADSRGARLLYDSLARMPGLTVTRNFLPNELFDASDSTVLILGADPQKTGEEVEDIREVRRLTKRGCRVVIAFAPFLAIGKPPVNKLNREWDVRLARDQRALYFGKSDGWTVVRRRGEHPVAIERAFDTGTVLLLASGGAFDNESTVAMDRLDDVTYALGPHRRIVFDETHFGIQQTGTIVGLARRFRLTGMGLALIACALLWIWRNAASFPPPPPVAATNRMAGRTSSSGLLTLLRRHIPASEIADVCWREWSSVNRRHIPIGAPEILRSAVAPLDKLRQLHALVAPKGRP